MLQSTVKRTTVLMFTDSKLLHQIPIPSKLIFPFALRNHLSTSHTLFVGKIKVSKIIIFLLNPSKKIVKIKVNIKKTYNVKCYVLNTDPVTSRPLNLNTS